MPLAAALALAILAAPGPAAPARPPAYDPAPIADAIQREDWPGLETLARAAAEKAPRDPQPWAWIGLALVSQGKVDEGEKALRRGIAVKETAGLRHRLGQLLLARGRTAEAEKELLRATRLAEGDQLWADLALAQVALGKVAAAERSLARARHLAPNPRAFEDVQVAIANRKALAGLPRAAAEALRRAEAAAVRGALEEAEKAYREVLRLAPRFGNAHYQLGRLAQARGDQAAAEREYRAALAKLQPYEVRTRADTCDALARTLLALGRKDGEARTWAEQAIGLRGEKPEYLVTLARACEEEGDRECAVDGWQRLADSPEPAPEELRKLAADRLAALKR